MWIGFAALLAVLMSSAPGLAQPLDDRTYGTAAKTFLALTPWDFRPISQGSPYVSFNNPTIGQTIGPTSGAGSGTYKAPLHLPEGALVTEVEFVFCVANALSSFSSALYGQPRMAAPSVVALVATAPSEAPGCVDRTAVLGTPVQIDNNANSYQLEVVLLGAGGFTTVQLGSARVGYVLQVSPPGPQIFDDVPPGHPFFPFVQALVAAGITVGCSASPPLYCPDNPVTRGQMAVFIARALGLHFAP